LSKEEDDNEHKPDKPSQGKILEKAEKEEEEEEED